MSGSTFATVEMTNIAELESTVLSYKFSVTYLMMALYSYNFGRRITGHAVVITSVFASVVVTNAVVRDLVMSLDVE